MELTPEQLINKLKNNEIPSNLITMFGEEDYYKSKANKLISNILFPDIPSDERDIHKYEANIKIEELKNDINSIPFFTENNLIQISDDKFFEKIQETDKKKLEEIIKNIPSYCYLIITIKKLDKRTKLYKSLKEVGTVCECKSLKAYQLNQWLNEQAEEEGGRFTYKAVATITEYLMPVENIPLKLLEQEIKKIAIFAKDRTEWNENDVKEIFAELPETSGFAINNAIAEKNIKLLLELIAQEKKKGTYLLPLCGLIQYQLKRMMRYLELKEQKIDKSEICSELKLPPFLYSKFSNQCQKFSKQNLETSIIKINELNINLRQGGRGYPKLEEILIQLIKA